MDLRFNTKSPFTKWIVREGVLQEPFVVVDVGVLGGENIRWHLLGDYLVVHGFDAIEEVVAQLREENAGNRKRVYHAIAAGNVDEERTFYFNTAGPTSSSFFTQGTDRYRADGSRTEEARTVPIRRLDSLLRDKLIPAADFLKVDVEGFEKDVLLGASTLLRSVLGAEIETNFNMSPSYPVGHFNEIYQLLLPAHLRVFDVNFNRVPRKHFRDALDRKGLAREVDWDQVGAVATLNALFCRDLIDEADHAEIYPTACEPASVDQLLKTMVICELHGLSDVAVDTAVRFRESLAERLDVDKAIDLLAERPSAVIYPIKPDGQLKHDHETYLGHIRELERTVVAEPTDRSSELAGLFGSLKAEHQAFLSRFLDLSGIAAKERGVYTAKVAELSATLRAEQEAFVARIRELELERTAWQSAHTGQVAELSARLVAEHEAFVARIQDLERERATWQDAHAGQVAELSATLRAEQEAFVARIRELELERATWQDAHAGQVAELSATLRAEQEAFVARIRELELERATWQDAHASQVAELSATLRAEHEAFVARIRELERERTAWQSAHAGQIADMQTVMDAERRASIDRVNELERRLDAEHEAFVARIRELERERAGWLSALPSHIFRQVLSALVAASERRGAVALGLRLVLAPLRSARRLVRRVLARPSAPVADGPQPSRASTKPEEGIRRQIPIE